MFFSSFSKVVDDVVSLTTDITMTTRRLLTDLKEQSGKNLKLWKPSSKEKVACLHSQWLRGNAIFKLCDGISLQKLKSS